MAVLQYDDVVRKIKSGSFERVYYFYGRDIMSVENITKLLIAKITHNGDESSYQKFIGKELGLSELYDYSEMFGGEGESFFKYFTNMTNDMVIDYDSSEEITTFVKKCEDFKDQLKQDKQTMIFYNLFDIKNIKISQLIKL